MNKNLKEINSKTDKEIQDLLSEKRAEIYKLNLDNKQNKLKNTRSIFNTRKDIARLLTVIREKELLNEKKIEEPVKDK